MIIPVMVHHKVKLVRKICMLTLKQHTIQSNNDIIYLHQKSFSMDRVSVRYKKEHIEKKINNDLF